MEFSVIFDMDGVIIDSNPYHRKAWQFFCKKHDIHLTESQMEQTVYGRTGEDALPLLFKRELNKEDIERYSEEINRHYRELFADYIKPLEGIEEFLRALKNQNIPCAIATSAPPVNVEFVLKHTGLGHYFRTIVDDTHIANGKPHPEIYEKAAEALSVNPKNCIVFEDSLSGIEAAKSAGMRVIGVATTHTHEELSHTESVIDDFRNISVSNIAHYFE